MAEWKKIESNVHKFMDVGEAIEGKLISKEPNQSFDKGKVYKIETKEGLKVIFGTSILDSEMESVNIGQMVKIVYVGEKENKKKGQNPLKLFEVFTQ